MESVSREMTFEEEYTFLKKEAKELFDKEDEESEPPKSHSVVRRALRCIKKLITEVKPYKQYNDLDEQGLLLRLPCGIGADVYFIPSETNFKLNILNDKPQFNRVYHQNVARITFIRNGWYMECDKDLQYATGNILVDKMYKETWFLSQAEAEQKLKEMNTDNGITE